MDVKLYRAAEGRKEITGTLAGYEDGAVTLATASGERTFSPKDVAQVRLHVDI